MPGRSRYDGAEIVAADVPDGAGGTRTVRYYRRRWPAAPSAQPPLARHRVGLDERLDLISNRYFGDPLAWWRVADANDALDPDALVDAEAEANILIIPVPGL
jgi:hypothetical protein